MNLLRIKRAVVCAALVVLCLAGAGIISLCQVAGLEIAPGSLQGEAAVRQLKADGGYASLAAAIAATRRQSNDALLANGALLTQQQKLTAADGATMDRFGEAVALSGETAVIGAPFDDVTGAEEQGSVHVFVRSGTSWRLQKQLVANDGAAGDRFGISVAISGDTIVVGAESAVIGGKLGQGAAYVFVRTGDTADADWMQQQKLIANDGAAIDDFGHAVAISDETVVVSAPFDDVGAAADQGSAYVFTRSGAVWTEQQKLVANDGLASDRLGTAVAISGETVVVGAGNDSVGANTVQGSAYVFTRSGTTWTQQQQLVAPDGAAFDNFGASVALSGDTALAGAPFKKIGANGSQGAAYVFTRSGSIWTLQQRLTAADGADGDLFGFSVALSGDTAVVGAESDDSDVQGNQGAAIVFARSGTDWTQHRKLTAGDGATGDLFGFSVALSGNTVLAGALNDDIGANADQGAAYVFVICANNFVEQQQLLANDGASADRFGSAIAVSSDIVVVGVPEDDIGAQVNQGSAYVFTRNGAIWTFQQRLIAADGEAGDRFGFSVAISDDTVVVGAPQDDNGGLRDQGSAYVFVRGGAGWTQQQKLISDDGASNDRFGLSVAVSGDTVVAGAAGDAIGMNVGQGSAYVFIRSGTNWTQQQKLTADDGARGDRFGDAVAVNGDTLVAGADGVNGDQGAVYIFARSGAVWTRLQKLVAINGQSDEFFGQAIALSGDTLLVGAPSTDIGETFHQGAAYVFVRNGAGWTPQQKLVSDDGASLDNFGFAVALSGDTAVVGAFADDSGTNADQGSAYVFTRRGAVWMQQQKLTANDAATGDAFGSEVAVSGDTVAVGVSFKKIGANVNQGAAYVFVCPACSTVMLDPDTLPDAMLGAPYSQTITASGDAGPFQFSLSDGALPPGLTIAQNGLLAGTPTAAGTYRFTVTATVLSSLCNGSRSYSLTVPGSCPGITVNPATLPNARLGEVYTQMLTATGGAAPFSFVVTAGALPGGLRLAANGVLSGIATVSGTFNFTVTAADANGCTATQSYALTSSLVTVTCVSAASFLPGVAPDSIAAVFGERMATQTRAAASLPLPTELADVRVRIRDSQGVERLAPLFFVSPGQINLQIPTGTASGAATLSVINSILGDAATSQLTITRTAPGLFAANANGQGVPAAVALRVRADGSQSSEPVARLEGNRFVPAPIDLGPANEQVFLVLFGAGIRFQQTVTASIGDLNANVSFAGAVAGFAGLDQVNVLVPRALIGRGEVDVVLRVDGVNANPVRVSVR